MGLQGQFTSMSS
ncbi:hypothetical protein HID58_011508 [Brassica napus]|uniref:Uncharacterized protein n=1 Tax=Brassica napus TaxID=3708 RepID=A0ABQ8DYH4_BRANA|nr:hypothetical protein HID58_011508 [Brassica napus]